MGRDPIAHGPRRPGARAPLRLAALALLVAACAKSEAAWRAELDDPDPFARGLAAIALSEIAPERSGDAALALVRVAQGARTTLRTPARRALARIGRHEPRALVDALRLADLDKSERRMLAQTLAVVGEPAIEPLARAMRDPGKSNARELGLVLVEIGEPAVPALAAQLDPANPAGARAAAAWMIGRIGPAADAALPALLEAIETAPGQVARTAIESAQRIEPEARRSLPSLLAALRREEPLVREAAVLALARVHLVRGSEADEGARALHAREVYALGEAAWPALIEAVDDRDEQRSRYASLLLLGATAHLALGGSEATPVWEAYLELGHDQASMRALTLLRIARAGPAARPALPLIVRATSDPSPAVRLCACWAFRCVALPIAGRG